MARLGFVFRRSWQKSSDSRDVYNRLTMSVLQFQWGKHSPNNRPAIVSRENLVPVTMVGTIRISSPRATRIWNSRLFGLVRRSQILSFLKSEAMKGMILRMFSRFPVLETKTFNNFVLAARFLVFSLHYLYFQVSRIISQLHLLLDWPEEVLNFLYDKNVNAATLLKHWLTRQKKKRDAWLDAWPMNAVKKISDLKSPWRLAALVGVSMSRSCSLAREDKHNAWPPSLFRLLVVIFLYLFISNTETDFQIPRLSKYFLL